MADKDDKKITVEGEVTTTSTTKVIYQASGGTTVPSENADARNTAQSAASNDGISPSAAEPRLAATPSNSAASNAGAPQSTNSVPASPTSSTNEGSDAKPTSGNATNTSDSGKKDAASGKSAEKENGKEANKEQAEAANKNEADKSKQPDDAQKKSQAEQTNAEQPANQTPPQTPVQNPTKTPLPNARPANARSDNQAPGVNQPRATQNQPVRLGSQANQQRDAASPASNTTPVGPGRGLKKGNVKNNTKSDQKKAPSAQGSSDSSGSASDALSNKKTPQTSKPTSKTSLSSGGAGGIKGRAIKAVAGEALDKVGKAVGVNKAQRDFLIQLLLLVVELLSGIGILLFVFQVVAMVIWLLKDDNFNQVKALLLPFAMIVTLGSITIFALFTVVIPVTACQIGQSSISSVISPGLITSIGSQFRADTGDFAEMCSQLNLIGAGVGSATSSTNTTSNHSSTTTLSTGSNGITLIQSTDTPMSTPIIDGTVLTRPADLPADFATQTNQAGYVSPADCRLGDLPYSEEITLRRVRLADDSEKIVTFPIHQTVECIQTDPTKTTVRSIHNGKIVRLVYDDPSLGNYITIEYPNNLRVSYYHLTLLPELTLGKLVNAGETIGSFGQTGKATFIGTTLLFELKTTEGMWKSFNPIDPQNADHSILTPFPCANNADKTCIVA